MIEIILLNIYIMFFIFNFGIIFAYLQQHDLTKTNDWTTNYTHALIISLPGFFGTISIIRYCHFPKYGWTLDKSKPKGKGTYKSIWD